MLLIVTNRSDPHADAVVHHLTKIGEEVIRLHPTDFYFDIRVAWNSSRCVFKIKSSGKTIHSDSVESVWYRRPGNIDQSLDGLFPQPERYIHSREIGAAVSSFYHLLDHAWWVSHPSNVHVASWKPYQLAQSKRVGLTNPDYLISNDREEISSFLKNQELVVIKPIHEQLTFISKDGVDYSLFVKRLESSKVLDAIPDHLPSPIFIQQYIRKKYDVRVTVFGDQIFAVALYDKDGAEIQDFRPHTMKLVHEEIELPDHIRSGVYAYLEAMNLNFGAFDFVVDHIGKWRFLECNPNGQWLWIEALTGLGLTEAMVAVLLQGKKMSNKT
jgi:glutathione synthase/RimK-type ligase-like ATP-grasp enzyme